MYAQQKDIEALFSKIKDSAKEALDTVKSIADHDAIKHNLNSKVCSLHYRESLDSVTWIIEIWMSVSLSAFSLDSQKSLLTSCCQTAGFNGALSLSRSSERLS